jgi:hypothetical protein
MAENSSFTPYFSVAHRNPGHWDIGNDKRRIFRIRGEHGNVVLYDERSPGVMVEPKTFRSVQAAMAWITDELMFETGEHQP